MLILIIKKFSAILFDEGVLLNYKFINEFMFDAVKFVNNIRGILQNSKFIIEFIQFIIELKRFTIDFIQQIMYYY